MILWVIGLDETRGVVPITPTDLADWWPKVAAEFSEMSPGITDLVVPSAGSAVTALLFDVSRKPFVVRNPAHGNTGGGAVELEVPWRTATGTRTARREDLLRILVPRQMLPHLEILSASVSLREEKPVESKHHAVVKAQLSDHLLWIVELEVYITPRTTDLLALPTHRASVRLRVKGSTQELRTDTLSFSAPHRFTGGYPAFVRDSSTVTTSAGEAVFTGPGLVHVTGRRHEVVRPVPAAEEVAITLAVAPAGSDLLVKTDVRLKAKTSEGDSRRSWALEKQE